MSRELHSAGRKMRTLRVTECTDEQMSRITAGKWLVEKTAAFCGAQAVHFAGHRTRRFPNEKGDGGVCPHQPTLRNGVRFGWGREPKCTRLRPVPSDCTQWRALPAHLAARTHVAACSAGRLCAKTCVSHDGEGPPSQSSRGEGMRTIPLLPVVPKMGAAWGSECGFCVQAKFTVHCFAQCVILHML